jgi:hypothetical protein
MFDIMRRALAHQVTVAAGAGIAIGTTSAAAVKIATTTTFTINSVAKSKTTAEVAFTATTHDIAADASNVKEACYLLCLNTSGTPTLTMGDIAVGAGNAQWPARPQNLCAIGGVRIAVAAGATNFTAATSLLSATQLTVTYYSIVGPYIPAFDGTHNIADITDL